MARQITITLPDPHYAALEARGAPFEQSGSEFLKQYVLACGMGEMPPLRLADLVAAHKPKAVDETPAVLMLEDASDGEQ